MDDYFENTVTQYYFLAPDTYETTNVYDNTRIPDFFELSTKRKYQYSFWREMKCDDILNIQVLAVVPEIADNIDDCIKLYRFMGGIGNVILSVYGSPAFFLCYIDNAYLSTVTKFGVGLDVDYCISDLSRMCLRKVHFNYHYITIAFTGSEQARKIALEFIEASKNGMEDFQFIKNTYSHIDWFCFESYFLDGPNECDLEPFVRLFLQDGAVANRLSEKHMLILCRSNYEQWGLYMPQNFIAAIAEKGISVTWAVIWENKEEIEENEDEQSEYVGDGKGDA